MAAVMIGVDPHKASHTAAAVGPAGEPLGDVPVRAPAAQAEQLLAWAAVWPERTWAVEGAPGWGTCWPSSSSRPGKWSWTSSPRWPPGCGCWRRGTPARTTPTTPARSRSPRSPARRRVAAEDHPAVLKLWTRALPGPGPGPDPGRLPAPRRARRPGPRRLQPGDHRRPGRQHAQAHQAVRPGRPGPPRARRRLHRSACAAWMPRSAKRGTSSPPRCQHRAPP